MDTRATHRRRPAVTILGGLLLLAAAGARAADTRGWLGIYHEAAPAPAEWSGIEGDVDAARAARAGLRVTAVWPDSPAEAGGLILGDLILGIDGRPFDCPPESVRAVFQRIVTPLRAGDRLRLLVLHDGVRKELSRNGSAAGRDEIFAFWRKPDELLERLAPGDELVARAAVRRAVEPLSITLGPRPEAGWPACKSDAEIDPAGRYEPSAFTGFVWRLVEESGRRADTEDLQRRLERCHETADPHRLDCMVFAHRQPFRLESLSRDLSERFERAAGPEEVLSVARGVLCPGGSPLQDARTPGAARNVGLVRPARDVDSVQPARNVDPPRPAWSVAPARAIHRRPAARLAADPARTARRPTRAEREAVLRPLLAQVESVLESAAAHRERAFSGLTEEDREFLAAHRYDLSAAFAADIYIHFDEDRNRFGRNRRLIDLAARIDYEALLAAARETARLVDPAWARAAGALVRAAFSDTLEAELLWSRETPHGRILLGGLARRWHRETDAAFVLDLGGDDFYTGNGGGSAGWSVPASICIDLQGNDAYESTTESCQGTGCLGVGALLDLEGDDQYIGLQWCQGTGCFGVGWLHDLAGNDTYRGRTFCQGVGLFGLGFLLDGTGDDRYEGDAKVQGVGLAHGIGALLDRAGDDRYYAKGLYPTGYGDAGIFDAWSQGCGIGFRTVASGGLGLLLDGGGADEMEAGNFAQGGGYYYGLGIVRAFGRDGDRYVGSRYNQGFSAHQAVGVFLEEGGDDFYTTRQAVAQGLAWDECVTLFIDEAGDDRYQGGGGFSQGASAHNSFCFFLDRAGRDRYEYPAGQALAGGNDYHGGTSLSFFVDEGGAADAYDASISGNGARRVRPAHGIFLDLPGTLAQAGDAAARRRLRRIE